jgi:mevalonate kinase
LSRETTLHPCTVQACGKVIIVGEHAVVYGVPAIAIPLHDMKMEAVFSPQKNPGATTEIFLDGRPAPAELMPLIDKAFGLLSLAPFPAIIKGSSQIFAGAGLGSSAALCIALLRGLSTCAGITLAPETLAYCGNELERHFHGTPSGLDTAVVAFEQVICFQKKAPPHANSLQQLPVRAITTEGPGHWPFMLVDSMEHCPTYQMIEQVRPFLRGEAGDRRLEVFARLTAEVASGLAQGRADELASAMNEAAALLGECGVVTPTMAEIMDAARQVGVLAAKPTGAGGGGNILLLLDPALASAQYEVLARRLNEHRIARVNLPPQAC